MRASVEIASRREIEMFRVSLSRCEFVASTAAALATACVGRAAAAVPSLKDTFKDMFLIGTALDFRSANTFNPAELDLIKSQFNDW
jgi:hypothetical protein